jgi:energy-converting hydrogenase Eha subunit E
VAIIVIGSLAAVAVKHFSGSPATSAAVARQEKAVGARAAAWVAGQVSPDVTVSCDVVMCAALKADGFPAGKLVVLGPASPDPVPSVLVVETATVRELFGGSLATASAPVALASFGSGSSTITVRVVAPHGAAAYRASLNADLAGRKASGAALLKYSRITVSATARSQLVAGQVDSRLLLALALLAGSQPVDIVRFGNPGPGASPGVPLRFVDLAESVAAAHMDSAAYARAALAVLGRIDAPVRPARAVSGPVQGQAVLRVEFVAPSPLGSPAEARPDRAATTDRRPG